MKSVDPASGETIADHPDHTVREVEARLERAVAAQRAWAADATWQRAEPLLSAARALEEQRDEHATRMAREMGKPVSQGRDEAAKCAWVCRYYAEHAARFLSDEPLQGDAARSFVAREPLGVVLAIMPWNFPYWQVFRFAAPALMAGNAVLLKHANNVRGCAEAIEALLRGAGLPEGLFANLFVPESAVGALLDDPRVAAVTLTGSVAAGRAVAARAGAGVKKSVLELGGSDPYLVLEDADLELAVETCVASRLINNGQSCIAAKRFLVTEPVRAAFERGVVERLARVRAGSPLAEGTDLGPLARRDLRDQLDRQVRESLERGARRLVGGEVPDGPGNHYPATLLVDVPPGAPAREEELFGPVAALIEVRDEEHAIEVANASSFGLGAAVFTRDAARGERVARRLEAGVCAVNDLVRSDPRMPFGGIKRSGYGRELSALGIREFVNAKTITVA